MIWTTSLLDWAGRLWWFRKASSVLMVSRCLSVAEHLGLRARSEKPGLIGRSCMAHVAAQDQADAELVGRAGVDALLAGHSGCMVSLLPLERGRAATTLVPLGEAGGTRRAVPPEWLHQDGFAGSEKLRNYLQPLVGDFAYPMHL